MPLATSMTSHMTWGRSVIGLSPLLPRAARSWRWSPRSGRSDPSLDGRATSGPVSMLAGPPPIRSSAGLRSLTLRLCPMPGGPASLRLATKSTSAQPPRNSPTGSAASPGAETPTPTESGSCTRALSVSRGCGQVASASLQVTFFEAGRPPAHRTVSQNRSRLARSITLSIRGSSLMDKPGGQRTGAEAARQGRQSVPTSHRHVQGCRPVGVLGIYGHPFLLLTYIASHRRSHVQRPLRHRSPPQRLRPRTMCAGPEPRVFLRVPLRVTGS